MSTQNLIQIKRSETTKTPASLANGELAWSSNGNVLYVGDFGTVRSVGGEHITGTNEVDVSYAANGEVTIGLAANVDFSNLDANTFALSGYLVDSFTNDLNVSASNTQLVAADEIKDYVDTEIATGIASIDNINDVDTTGKAQGDVLAYDGSNWVDYDVIGDNGFNVTSNTTALSLNVDAQDGLEANSTGLFVTTGNGLTIDGNGNVAISSGDDVTFGDVAVEGDLTVTLVQIMLLIVLILVLLVIIVMMRVSQLNTLVSFVMLMMKSFTFLEILSMSIWIMVQPQLIKQQIHMLVLMWFLVILKALMQHSKMFQPIHCH